MKAGLILFAVGLLLGAVIVYAVTPSSTFYISSGVYPGAPSYTIWREDSNYFAKDDNGMLKFSGTNETAVVESSVNALTDGGKILLKDIQFPANVVLPSDVIIEEDYQGRVTYYPRKLFYKYYDGFKVFTRISYRAIYEDNKIIMPYQDGTNISVKIYDYRNFTEIDDNVIDIDPLPGDCHGTPSMTKFGNYYVSIYGSHSWTGTLKVSYSTDLESWTTYNFPISGNYTYPQTFVWTDGDFYVVLRNSVSATQTDERLYKCTDITNSGSWSLINVIVNNGNNWSPYVTTRLVNDCSRLLMAYSLYCESPAGFNNRTYAIYSDNLSTWYNVGDNQAITLPSTDANSLLYQHSNITGSYDYAIEQTGNDIYVLAYEETRVGRLIKQTLGGAQTVYTLTGAYGRSSWMFATDDGGLRIFLARGESTSLSNYWRNYRWWWQVEKFKDGCFLVEEKIGLSDKAFLYPPYEVFGLTNVVMGSYTDESLNNQNSNVNTIILLERQDQKVFP